MTAQQETYKITGITKFIIHSLVKQINTSILQKKNFTGKLEDTILKFLILNFFLDSLNVTDNINNENSKKYVIY